MPSLPEEFQDNCPGCAFLCVGDHMEVYDDDLRKFEAEGAAALPAPHEEGYVENNGARIWYASYGAGAPVILLHGGLGHSGNWGYQVPVLVQNGYRAVLIDSRGHAQSSRDEQAHSYELIATDVMAGLYHFYPLPSHLF